MNTRRIALCAIDALELKVKGIPAALTIGGVAAIVAALLAVVYALRCVMAHCDAIEL